MQEDAKHPWRDVVAAIPAFLAAEALDLSKAEAAPTPPTTIDVTQVLYSTAEQKFLRDAYTNLNTLFKHEFDWMKILMKDVMPQLRKSTDKKDKKLVKELDDYQTFLGFKRAQTNVLLGRLTKKSNSPVTAAEFITIRDEITIQKNAVFSAANRQAMCKVNPGLTGTLCHDVTSTTGFPSTDDQSRN